MRGERLSLRGDGLAVLGSSPHARGTRGDPRRHPMGGRFIPACAGNAHAIRLFFLTQPVHPRMRGERIFNRAQKRGVAGSSPHARGTPAGCSVGRRSLRFIPACAGNADLLHARSSSLTVHPRMRGERWTSTVSRHSRIGSSPHARGTPAREARVHYQHRFIPACAGNASAGWTGRCASSVHPRMRGERMSSDSVGWIAYGSSPHARGTHGSAVRRHHLVRFIPACAGNAFRCVALCRWVSGSSPHARGTLLGVGRLIGQHRFIPACAGNALAWRICRRR